VNQGFGVVAPMILVLNWSVFVEKSGEYGVVRFDIYKVMEISMRVSGEPRIGNTMLELRDTEYLRHLKENVDNGGGGRVK